MRWENECSIEETDANSALLTHALFGSIHNRLALLVEQKWPRFAAYFSSTSHGGIRCVVIGHGR